MREYRDDLQSAHERIARLEQELARERAPKRANDRNWLVGLALGGFLIVGFFGMCAFVFVRAWSSSPSVSVAPVSVAPSVPAYVPKIYTRFFAQREMPLRADVDGDGKKEFIGFFWAASNEETPLWVAALDPVTFQPKWATGPFRAQWAGTRTHLALAGDKVLVSDSQGTLHVLALADGKVVAKETFEGGVTQMCPAADAPNNVRIRSGVAASSVRIFDPDTRAFTTPTKDPSCGGTIPACDERSADHCEGRGTGELEAPTTERREGLVHHLGSGDRRVAIGYARDGELVPMVGWKRGARTLDWRVPDLVVTGDARHYGPVRTSVGHRRVASLYQTKAGPFRVVVHEMESGKPIGDAIVPKSLEGSYFEAFGIDGDDVIVALDQRLVVYDARDMSVRADLESVSLPMSK